MHKPTDGKDLLLAASKAIGLADYSHAIELLELATQQYPREAEVYWQVGRLFGLNEKYGEAAKAFRQAAQMKPTLSSTVFSINANTIQLQDSPGSLAAAMIVEEAGRDLYGLRRMKFAPGDVVLDIGAHIGSVSIILGKLYPDIKIYAYEPSQHNFDMLTKNLSQNKVTNVTPIKKAVSGKAGSLELMWSPLDTAASGSCINDDIKNHLGKSGWEKEVVQSVTLSDVFADHSIDRCAWLKLDCEGSEYDIFQESAVLERVDKISLELHVPMSKHALGEDACRQEFLGLLNRLSRRPQVEISSTVWMFDSMG